MEKVNFILTFIILISVSILIINNIDFKKNNVACEDTVIILDDKGSTLFYGVEMTPGEAYYKFKKIYEQD